jgi:hypothetical protein
MRPRAVESAGGGRALCEPRYQHLAKMPGTAANDGLGIPRFLDKLERAAVRWHGRLKTEATFLSLAESQLAIAALASLCAGERDAIQVLRRLLRRVGPTVVRGTADYRWR